MRGIGNDIIDLASVDISRAGNPRFYSKILSDTELQLYYTQFAALPFHQFLWLLWSVKESAYKCLQRHQPDLVFTPVKVVVTQIIATTQNPVSLIGELTGTGFHVNNCFRCVVDFNNYRFHSRSVIYGDKLIHTIATFSDNFDSVQWGIKQIERTSPESQSAEVRKFLLARLEQSFPNKELTIAKHSSGYPFIVEDDGRPISLSHHGGFVGYAF